MTDFYDLFNTSWMVQKEDEVSIRIVNIITYPQKPNEVKERQFGSICD